MEHRITLDWRRNDGPFERGNYAREHRIRFDGGQMLRNSAAPDYGGDAAAANPEELLLAALASCHMLTILAVLANRGYVVEGYDDAPVAVLEKNAEGKMAVTRITLRPAIHFSGANQPSADELAKFHERAHSACFIANSIRSEVHIVPR
ncbi:OsmC family protein [Tahibacter amnicola]|uniref:OsmC family protein n=1 Tax=Tahibacter amnicola TaxID=2976241 RepID=A0ABY6BDZ1_9GAMM|nr:OsmC family protein [Tahibacter amnicola]UXI67325.1 OsmC family protein [Tahibacter amnicola]